MESDRSREPILTELEDWMCAWIKLGRRGSVYDTKVFG